MTRLLFIILLSVTLTACGTGKRDKSHNSDKLRIAVAIEPQRFIVEAIAGDKAEVMSLLERGSDPETYDPTLASLMALSRSDAYFKLGTLAFEDNLLDRLKRCVPVIYDSSDGIELIEGTHCHGGHEEHGSEHTHEYDPHIWSSVKNCRIMAEIYADALISLDPADSVYYKNRLNELIQRLDSIDDDFSRRLASVAGEPFMVWHPTLSYFARDYGLTQLSVGSENKETTIQGLNRTIDAALSQGVNLFFSQPGYDPRISATVRSHVEARCVEINPLAYDWVGQLETAVDALTAVE